MKASSLLAITLIMALIILGSAILVRGQTTQKETFTQDFGDCAYVNSAGTNVFAYDIIQSYQTEPNGGGWISGSSYQANWTIRLDYVNQSIVNGSSYIVFYLPQLNGSYIERGFPPENVSQEVPVVASNSQTQLSLEQKTGMFSATFEVENNSEGFYQNFNFPFRVYSNGEIIYSGTTNQDCDISSQIMNSQSPASNHQFSDAPEFPSSLIILSLLLSVFFVAAILRHRKFMNITNVSCSFASAAQRWGNENGDT
jgi:hypothetical protein